MKILERFFLYKYQGINFPGYISQFQNLRNLSLESCPELRVLPTYETVNEIAGGDFPMLKKLILSRLRNLESMVTSEESMPELEEREIEKCRIGNEEITCSKQIIYTSLWWVWSTGNWEWRSSNVRGVMALALGKVSDYDGPLWCNQWWTNVEDNMPKPHCLGGWGLFHFMWMLICICFLRFGVFFPCWTLYA